MKQSLIFAAGLLAFAATPIFASTTFTPCPILTGGSTSNGGAPSSVYTGNTAGGTANGCNVLITFNANGSANTTNPNAAPSYDSGGDDNLIGIVNNTSAPITQLTLSSSVTGADAIFNFDLDGVCSSVGGGYTFAPGTSGTPCLALSSTDPGDYQGATSTGGTTTFSGINAALNSGLVTFGGGGIAAGGTAFFSLEGPVDITLTVHQTPEPASMLLIGTGLSALYFIRRRRKAKA